MANVPDTFFIPNMTCSIKEIHKKKIFYNIYCRKYLSNCVKIRLEKRNSIIFLHVDGPVFRSILNYYLARFLKASMWHLTKYARFVETATPSESKNTWEVIHY